MWVAAQKKAISKIRSPAPNHTKKTSWVNTKKNRQNATVPKCDTNNTHCSSDKGIALARGRGYRNVTSQSVIPVHVAPRTWWSSAAFMAPLGKTQHREELV